MQVILTAKLLLTNNTDFHNHVAKTLKTHKNDRGKSKLMRFRWSAFAIC